MDRRVATTVISLSGKKAIYGARLELPQAKNIVYVGRKFTMGGWKLEDSRFHNPFKVSEDTRENVVKKYEKYIVERLKSDENLLKELMSYKGKILACWCSPELCHADVLKKIIDCGLENKMCAVQPGHVLCGQKPGRGKGSYPTFYTLNGSEYVNIPAYSRGAGDWKNLSPFFLKPELWIETMPDGTRVERTATCIENFWQATKVETRLRGTTKNDPPKKEWWDRREKLWNDPNPQRHVIPKKDRIADASAERLHYWNGKYITYEEARKIIYIPFYWSSAEKTVEFEKLVDMRKRGINFQLIGPDGRNVKEPIDGYYGGGLYRELQDSSKPFGHELVLIAMLLKQRVHEWKIDDDSILINEKSERAIEVLWPLP